jgi:hypothetical protein
MQTEGLGRRCETATPRHMLVVSWSSRFGSPWLAQHTAAGRGRDCWKGDSCGLIIIGSQLHEPQTRQHEVHTRQHEVHTRHMD